MDIEGLIHKMVEELHLGDAPNKDKNGFFHLKIQPNLSILIKDLLPGLFVSAKIIELPKEGNNEALYLHLMQANVLGRDTGGGAIGIDITEKHLTLSQILPFAPEYKVFYETVEDFVNYIDYWKQKIPALT